MYFYKCFCVFSTCKTIFLMKIQLTVLQQVTVGVKISERHCRGYIISLPLDYEESDLFEVCIVKIIKNLRKSMPTLINTIK